MLTNKYLPPQRPPTMQTVTRCGDNVIADIDNATGTVVRRYVTPMLDSNVSMTDVGTAATYYYNADERQSVMNLTDSTGAVVQSYGYTAYGDQVDALTNGSVEQRYTYTGRELSDASGDYYFRYRTYSAGTGSFMSRDPWKYIDGMSMYSGWFAMVLGLDPKGLEWKGAVAMNKADIDQARCIIAGVMGEVGKIIREGKSPTMSLPTKKILDALDVMITGVTSNPNIFQGGNRNGKLNGAGGETSVVDDGTTTIHISSKFIYGQLRPFIDTLVHEYYHAGQIAGGSSLRPLALNETLYFKTENWKQDAGPVTLCWFTGNRNSLGFC